MARRKPKTFNQFWENQSAANPYSEMSGLESTVEGLFGQGYGPKDFRGLFSEGVQNLFAPNAAAGQGQPSPYLPYFQQNPGALMDLLQMKGIRSYGTPAPGQPPGAISQQQLFDQFSGLRDSYIGATGNVEVSNPGGGSSIYDPTDRFDMATMNSILRAGGKTLTPPMPTPTPTTGGDPRQLFNPAVAKGYTMPGGQPPPRRKPKPKLAPDNRMPNSGLRARKIF